MIKKMYDIDVVGKTSTGSTAEDILAGTKGKFAASLLRNNKQIKADRGLAIVEDAEMIFKRTVEDIETKIKRMKRDRDNMLDLSPGDKVTLKLAVDFDAPQFVTDYLALGISIRNEEIKLGIAKQGYNELFGETYKID